MFSVFLTLWDELGAPDVLNWGRLHDFAQPQNRDNVVPRKTAVRSDDNAGRREDGKAVEKARELEQRDSTQLDLVCTTSVRRLPHSIQGPYFTRKQ